LLFIKALLLSFRKNSKKESQKNEPVSSFWFEVGIVATQSNENGCITVECYQEKVEKQTQLSSNI